MLPISDMAEGILLTALCPCSCLPDSEVILGWLLCHTRWLSATHTCGTTVNWWKMPPALGEEQSKLAHTLEKRV